MTSPSQKKGHRRLPSTTTTPNSLHNRDPASLGSQKDTDVKRTSHKSSSGSGAAIAMTGASLSPSGPSDVSSPHSEPRPRIMSYPSNSAPSTPQQHPRDAMRSMRTPSPGAQSRQRSPRSASSESHKAHTNMHAVSARCRFQSTQTSRRRMPYNIGAEPLEAGKPTWNMTRDRRQQITTQCEALYQKLLPSADSQRRRDELVVKLQRILREEMPDNNIKVDVFGSSGNLLCTSDSDGTSSSVGCELPSFANSSKLMSA